MNNLTTSATVAPVVASETMEFHCCPYCGEKDIQEAAEKITSLKSVDINEVDDWLAKGYCVHETFSKQATIKLLEKKP